MISAVQLLHSQQVFVSPLQAKWICLETILGYSKGVVCKNGDADINGNGGHLLQCCCNNILSIINTLFLRRGVYTLSPRREIRLVNSQSLISA